MGFINPVRRSKARESPNSANYLPCVQCKGFFKRTYIHRHVKICHQRSNNVDSRHARANGMTLLHMTNDKTFQDLKINVFPHMIADEVTKTVMGDDLIKFYGARYYRSHQEGHLINTTSQRMRQLAKFLLALRIGELQLKSLTNYLRPRYFFNLVAATLEMTGYDPLEKTFRNASAASNWGTVLKDLCDAAMFVATTQDELVMQEEIRRLKEMIASEFKNYVSRNARKDLETKKWDKCSMLPLTEDIMLMNKFVTENERFWAKKLQEEPSNIIFLRNLTEVLLTHSILLNRKRSGEAQRIKVKDYQRETYDGVENIYDSLTPTEKVLTKTLKRFVVRGKRGRAVPVIFTADMQKHTEVLLKSKELLCPKNEFLFGNPSTENSHLWAYHVLKKVGESCGVLNIESVTATKLRKHVATTAQLISLSDNDLEQLATHLGHEKATHLNYYRQTDDQLQIARVSKLLLLMEKNPMSEFRGLSLDEMDLTMPNMEDEADVLDTTASTSKILMKDHNQVGASEEHSQVLIILINTY